MDTNFSLHRILLLLKADWIEHRKNYLFSMGALLLVWLFIIFILKLKTTDVGQQAAVFVFGGLVTFLFYCRHVGNKVHKSISRYYTLPASTLEKYLTLLIEGCIFFITYLVIFYSGLLVWKLITPEAPIITLKDITFKNGSESGIFFLTSLIFLSYMTFRKHAFLIAIAGLATYIAVFAGFYVRILKAIHDNNQGFFKSSFLFDSFEFGATLYTPLMILFSVIMLCIGYLKLKEKELR
ncbi:hypothetical protein M2459_001029 [Parabacteroides sp. PF5-5]|uniref:hypothetical protein n=1 Tax=unclassified Parabacteroides TaxID=2649774 RepID=UPI0024750074|nr:MULTISPECIES: hypothetical protein [unclassified Parabacteroides]MDH6304297.1 hypothetical protein [Parabacteroides sp. PH5-39]MDH6315550.1 hypothetical protein [Parabacteroides sp. PF5-13]MDH6318956.1 hypothetical protein [Parabacteroides sp. PH5-13]MDH6322685.1 hypothetical protein [Parabacteroides sp. PH5-8]MDH6326743.1 hypothetical protein [Parabacteroides sp. PH5-41]